MGSVDNLRTKSPQDQGPPVTKTPGYSQSSQKGAESLQEPPLTKVTTPPVTKMANKVSKKRSSVSFDTGTIQGKDTRYQAIKSAIKTGKLKPSTHQLRKHWQCNYETAAAYLASMAKEGLLNKNLANNQYTLGGHHESA